MPASRGFDAPLRGRARRRARRRERIRRTRASAARAERSPLEYARLTRPQWRFCRGQWDQDPKCRGIDARIALWRGGNQLGKSWGMAFDLWHYARGTGHHQGRRNGKPVRILVISESWDQMEPLLEKIWELAPKDEIDPKVGYSQGAGLTGYKQPHIKLVSGPGAGTVIYFATYKQGAKRIAGGNYHRIYADEPMPERVYGELMPRLSRHHGEMRITMTPTPESPPMAWLRKKVADGEIAELQTSFCYENICIQGGLLGERAWKTIEQVQEILESYLPVERDMREHGAWDPLAAGRWLTAWHDGLLVTDGPVEGRLWIAVGIDHGVAAGRQVAELVVYQEFDDGRDGVVWFLDEVLSDGRTTIGDDAAAILEMLARWGWSWRNVDFWVGDRAHSGDENSARKSNQDLEAAIAELVGLDVYEVRAAGLNIPTARKRKGSVSRGLRIMNSFFAYDRGRVSMRCQGLLEAIKGWEGKKQDPRKDRLDAGRYALEVLVDQAVAVVPVPATAAIY